MQIILFKLPQCLYPAEDQANNNARYSNKEKQHRRTRAFSAAENAFEQAALRIFHKRLKDIIHQKAAKKITDGNGEKLQGVSDGIDPPLHLLRHIAPENNVIICAHQRDNAPAEKCTDTPYNGVISESKQEIFRAHGYEQAVADNIDPALWLWKYGCRNASEKCCHADKAVYDTVCRLACF